MRRPLRRGGLASDRGRWRDAGKAFWCTLLGPGGQGALCRPDVAWTGSIACRAAVSTTPGGLSSGGGLARVLFQEAGPSPSADHLAHRAGHTPLYRSILQALENRRPAQPVRRARFGSAKRARRHTYGTELDGGRSLADEGVSFSLGPGPDEPVWRGPDLNGHVRGRARTDATKVARALPHPWPAGRAPSSRDPHMARVVSPARGELPLLSAEDPSCPARTLKPRNPQWLSRPGRA